MTKAELTQKLLDNLSERDLRQTVRDMVDDLSGSDLAELLVNYHTEEEVKEMFETIYL
jgi:hypothetical protein